MNQIYYYTETAEEIVIVDEADEDGNIIATETTAIVTTLYITVVHKTAETMAEEYSFTDEQKQMLSDLLLDENASLWAAVPTSVVILKPASSPNSQVACRAFAGSVSEINGSAERKRRFPVCSYSSTMIPKTAKPGCRMAFLTMLASSKR